MTKHPATDAHTPPQATRTPETGNESHPRNSGREKPLSNPTSKWRIRRIRAERWAEMQRQTHAAGIRWDRHHRDPQHERGNLTKYTDD